MEEALGNRVVVTSVSNGDYSIQSGLKIFCRRTSTNGKRDTRRRGTVNELTKRAAEAEQCLKRLFDAIESGVADLGDPSLKERVAELTATRDQARIDAKLAKSGFQNIGQHLSPEHLSRMAVSARQKTRGKDGGFRRDHLRALAHRVEVADQEIRIMGAHDKLIKALAASNGVGTAANGVRTYVPRWRMGWDSNPRDGRPPAGFQDRCLQPLGHPSVATGYLATGCRTGNALIAACLVYAHFGVDYQQWRSATLRRPAPRGTSVGDES